MLMALLQSTQAVIYGLPCQPELRLCQTVVDLCHAAGAERISLWVACCQRRSNTLSTPVFMPCGPINFDVAILHLQVSNGLFSTAGAALCGLKHLL